jgi:hypothetical protein
MKPVTVAFLLFAIFIVGISYLKSQGVILP